MLKRFARFVSLNILGMIGLSFYILADTYFISKGIGADGLTSLNLALPVYNLIYGIGMMTGVGGATLFSIRKAEGKDKTEGNKIFTNVILTLTIFAICFILTGLFFSGNISRLLGANDAVYEMTRIYLKVVLLFSPAFMLNSVIMTFVRNDGAPGLAMAATLSGSFFNIVMDYILIFPAGLGMLGAVLATGFSPVVGMLVMSVHFIRKRNSFCLIKTKLSPAILGKVFALGLPSFITELSAGIVIIVFNMLFLKYAGNTGVAAYGVIANIALVTNAMFNGVAQGSQPLVSESAGAGNRRDMKFILFMAVLTVCTIAGLAYLGLFVNKGWVVGVFNSEKNTVLQKIAENGLVLYFISLPFTGINIVMASFFAASGSPVPGQIISSLRGFILAILVPFVMAVLFKITGIWLALPVTEMLTFAVGLVMLNAAKD